MFISSKDVSPMVGKKGASAAPKKSTKKKTAKKAGAKKATKKKAAKKSAAKKAASKKTTKKAAPKKAAKAKKPAKKTAKKAAPKKAKRAATPPAELKRLDEMLEEDSSPVEDVSARIYGGASEEDSSSQVEGYEIVEERPLPQAAREHPRHDDADEDDEHDGGAHEHQGAGMHEEHEDESGVGDEEERHARPVSNRPQRRRKPRENEEGNGDENTIGDLDELPDFSTDVGDPDDFL
jgi:hypothetical protein